MHKLKPLSVPEIFHTSIVVIWAQTDKTGVCLCSQAKDNTHTHTHTHARTHAHIHTHTPEFSMSRFTLLKLTIQNFVKVPLYLGRTGYSTLNVHICCLFHCTVVFIFIVTLSASDKLASRIWARP